MTPPPNGEVLTRGKIQSLITQHLEKWLTTYLCEVDEEEGLARGTTAWPRSYQRVPKLNNDLNKQLPALLVICPGTSDKPTKEGDGNYRAKYTVGIAALVKGSDQVSASEIAGRYGAAIRQAIVQQLSYLGDHVRGASWEGESFDDLAVDTERTMASVTVHFDMEFRNVLNDRVGPSRPVFGEETPEPPENPKEGPQKGPGPIIPDEDHISVTIVSEELV